MAWRHLAEAFDQPFHLLRSAEVTDQHGIPLGDDRQVGDAGCGHHHAFRSPDQIGAVAIPADPETPTGHVRGRHCIPGPQIGPPETDRQHPDLLAPFEDGIVYRYAGRRPESRAQFHDIAQPRRQGCGDSLGDRRLELPDVRQECIGRHH